MNSSKDVSRLYNLPSELIMCIADHLGHRDMSSLSKTCVRFAQTLRSPLRRLGIKRALPTREEYLQYIDIDSNPPTIRTSGGIMIPRPHAMLFDAVGRNDIGAVRSFLDLGIDPNSFHVDGYRLLQYAIASCADEIARLLLIRGADLSLPCLWNPEMTPLYCAAVNHRSRMIGYLITAGANVQQPGLIHVVVRYCNKPTVEYVIRHGGDVFEVNAEKGKNVLHYAVRNEDTNVVGYLLGRGLRDGHVNAVNRNGWTPLMRAMRYRNEDAAEALLAWGADATIREPNGNNTALHMAVDRRMLSATLMICEKGAAIDAANFNGRTALHLAAMAPMVSLVQVLLSHGANPNHRDTTGQTALHVAVHEDNGDQEAIVGALIRAGIDVHAKASFNFTAFQIARDRGYDRAAYMIETQDADVFRGPPPRDTWDDFLHNRYQ
jgi:ankyrin repeat protein